MRDSETRVRMTKRAKPIYVELRIMHQLISFLIDVLPVREERRE